MMDLWGWVLYTGLDLARRCMPIRACAGFIICNMQKLCGKVLTSEASPDLVLASRRRGCPWQMELNKGMTPPRLAAAGGESVRCFNLHFALRLPGLAAKPK